MIRKIKRIVLGLMTIVITGNAQNFNYQAQTSTGQSYNDIADTTIIRVLPFEDHYKLPIGFSFNCAGRTTDSLTIRSTGLLTFDNESKYNFIALNKEFIFDADASSASSVVYKTDTSTSIHILKLQFKNMLLVRGEEKIHFNFQVWLYQYTGKIEFRMGEVTGNMPSENCLIGLINMNNTAEASVGYLLQGNAETPSGILITAGGSLSELTATPATGTVYTFTTN